MKTPLDTNRPQQQATPSEDLTSMVLPDIPTVHLLRQEMREDMQNLSPHEGVPNGPAPRHTTDPIAVERFAEIFDAIQWDGGSPADTSEFVDSDFHGTVEIETVPGAPKEKFNVSVVVSDFNQDGFQPGQRYTFETPEGDSVTGDLAQIFLKQESSLVFVPKSSLTSENGASLYDPLEQSINLVSVQEKVAPGSPNATLEFDLLAQPRSEFPQPLKDALQELERRVAKPEGYHDGFEGGPHPIVDLDKPFNGKPLKEWLNEIPRIERSNGMQVVGPEAEEYVKKSLENSGVFFPPELAQKLAELHRTRNVTSDEVKNEVGEVKWRPEQE